MGTQEVQYMDGVQARLASHYKTPLNGCTQAGWMKGQPLGSRHSLFPSISTPPVFLQPGVCVWALQMFLLCGFLKDKVRKKIWRDWHPALLLHLRYPSPSLYILGLLSPTGLQQVDICNCKGGGKHHATLPSGIFNAAETVNKPKIESIPAEASRFRAL